MKFDLTYEDMCCLSEAYEEKAKAFERGAEACNGSLAGDAHHRRDFPVLGHRAHAAAQGGALDQGVVQPHQQHPCTYTLHERHGQ